MDSYIQAQRNNLDIGRQTPLFRELIGDADRAYRAVVDAHAENASPIFGQLILICHKSLVSAATLTAQSQPDDGAAITRRAVEVARTALAIKLNDQNAEQWLSFQQRHERWLRRQQNERPRTFQVHFQSIKGESLIDDLDNMLGVLSDLAVHFTPEYFIALDWEERRDSSGKGAIFLNYFHRDAREIERRLIYLGAAHLKILEVFDRCLDGWFRSTPAIWGALSTFIETGRRLNAGYERTYGINRCSPSNADETTA
jgi:hypothetical protein